MLISCRHGVGFICVPKCGSTSVEAALRKHADVAFTGNPAIKHMSMAQVEAHVIPLLEARRQQRPRFFAVVRPPVDWVRSWYNFRARDEIADPSHPNHGNFTGNMSFAEFVEEATAQKPRVFARIGCQADFVTRDDGSLGVETLIPLARLGAVLPDYLRGFGIPFDQKVPSRNVSPVVEGSDVDADVQARIAAHYARDTELYARAAA